MKIASIALCAAALIATSPAAFAHHGVRSEHGVSSKTPGHQMHVKASKKGYHGASGYAPGREMQAKGSKTSYPGASSYAPGQTTGTSTKRSY
jgi:hypothetical protein